MSNSRLALVKLRYRYFQPLESFTTKRTVGTKVLTMQQIVEPESAQIIGCGDPIPIRADHLGICKFNTVKDDGYENVVAAIRQTMLPLSATSPEASHTSPSLQCGLEATLSRLHV